MHVFRSVPIALLLTALSSTASTRAIAAADNWSEVKSPHFTVWSNTSDGTTRTLVWQLEQIRSAMSVLWPWMKVDLPRPMLVFGVKDEASIKALAPQYWERKGAIRPVSVWVTGPDQHYMVIRADLRSDDTDTLNPFISSYFSYASLIVNNSFGQPLPLWFSRGLAGVVSNTVVRDKYILLGPPIPWHLEKLRGQGRFSLKQLVSMTRDSPESKTQEGLSRFDAQAWALVHFLMFGDQGKHQAAINRFSNLLTAGKDPDTAFTEAIGRVQDLEVGFSFYIDQGFYGYTKAVVDAAVKREKFTGRVLSPAEAAGGRATFHVAMRRPEEARTLIEEARKADPNAPGAFVAEAIQLDRDDKDDAARPVYLKAAELGTSNAYALYRAAVMQWGVAGRPSPETLRQMETHLARAVELNPFFAAAHASLGEVRAGLGVPVTDAVAPLEKAVQLEPSDPWHRLAAARVLWRYGNVADARKAAEVALKLADDDRARTAAQRLLSEIAAASARPAAPAAGSPPASNPPASSTPDPNALVASCQRGDVAACRDLAPIAEKACAGGQKRACLITALLQARGEGLPKDEARAFATFEQLCNDGLPESCTQWAVILASHPQKPDIAKARQLLTKSCAGGFAEACEVLKSMPK